MDQERRWFVGVDWASQARQVRLTDADGSKLGERSFEHGGAGLTELATWILAATDGFPIIFMSRSRCRTVRSSKA